MSDFIKTMETADLKQRITQGENTTTEFKESFDQEVIETAAAFANTDKGLLYVIGKGRGTKYVQKVND